MALTSSVFIQLTDKAAARYLKLMGSLGSGFGAGNGNATLADDWGYSKATREYLNLLIASGDPSVIQSMIGASTSSIGNAPIAFVGRALLTPDIRQLEIVCNNAGITGVTGIASFANYYNTSAGGPFNALLTPDFGAVFQLVYPSATTLMPTSFYSPPVANMGQISFGGGLVPGTAIDPMVYAGAATATVTVSSSTWSGPGAITVTGQATNSVGIVFTGRAFTTAAISADGVYALTPSVAGDKLLSVSAMALPGALTAGTAIVSGGIPAGRSYPAT